ncbi:iron complex transport system ATP-binding protein [Thalassotalea agarivorans]|uniref:Iron complex transport system ATP-binding protein n=1 Tax=Thalassotalea agarivorans TaxID=349064 RepID=A0A1I0G817_THASX|nr:iron complex transport system ATP-binding protein [Thalassotalea agarivorans]
MLDNIDFNVNEGEFIGVLGPNGAGKTSLLKCLYRAVLPSSGNIFVFNQPLNSLSIKQCAKTIAVVTQQAPECFGLSVLDVVSLGLLPHKTLFESASQQDKLFIDECLERVGLLDKKLTDFSILSGGQQQRALLAKALVQRPKILLLDEPTAHLDIQYQVQVLSLLKAQKCTVIASFHDLNLASHYSDKIVLLNKGKQVAVGTPTEVLTSSFIEDVYHVDAQVSLENNIPYVRYDYEGGNDVR